MAQGRRAKASGILLLCIIVGSIVTSVVIGTIVTPIVVGPVSHSSVTVPVETTSTTGYSIISRFSVTPSISTVKGASTLSQFSIFPSITNIRGVSTLSSTSVLPFTATVMGVAAISTITITPSATTVSTTILDPIIPQVQEVIPSVKTVSPTIVQVTPVVGTSTTESDVQTAPSSTVKVAPAVGTTSVSPSESSILHLTETITPGVGTVNVMGITQADTSTTSLATPIVGTITTTLSIWASTTVVNLAEKISTQSTLIETFLYQKTTFEDVTVSGDLEGTIDFTNFEIISIETGSFGGKGFSKGEFTATLEGLPYKGDWKGMVFLEQTERKIHLKGMISGEISGIVESYLTESTLGSNVYDQYQATWRLNRLGADFIYGVINLNGMVTYQESTEYSSTEIYVLQTSIEGTCAGHYTGPLSAVLTHLRVVDEINPFFGEGFSIITYISNFGSGEGWTYDKLIGPSRAEMKGIFTSPLVGIVSATLDETKSPRTLFLTIERIDLGLSPMPDLKVETWGPGRVSPGQTITYIVQLRNDGLKPAENITVVNELPWQVDYISDTGGGVYKEYFREVDWHLNLSPKSKVYLTTQSRVMWGLLEGTILGCFTNILEKIEIETDPTIGMSFDIIESNKNYSKVKAIIFNQSKAVSTIGEIFIIEVPEKKEPTIEINQISEDMIEIVYKFTVESRSWDEITVKFVENIGAIDKLLEFITRFPEYIDNSRKFKEQQDWANNLYEKRKIYEKPWKDLQRMNEVEYVLQTILKELAKFPPISGEFVSKRTWDEPIRRFVQHYRWTRIAVYDIDLFLDQYDVLHESRITVARDPNIKYGPEGNVLPGQKLDYKVEYENEGEGIAFGVYFTDTLDEDLDDSTLEIGPVIDVNTGVQIAMPGVYNTDTRTITWFVGEVGPGKGGYTEFNVNVRSDAPDGTEIINFATVYFPSVPETTKTNGIVSIVMLNHPPLADANGPYIGDEASAIIFDASHSSDPDGDVLKYRWDFNNDGIWDTDWSTSPTAIYTWCDDYEGIINLEVSDEEFTDTDIISVTIFNVPPSVDAGPDKTTNEGDLVYFSGSFTDPCTVDTHNIIWNFGDEGSASGTLTPNHYYGDNGVYTAALTVTDDDGGAGINTLIVTVNNVAPTVEAGEDQTMYSGDAVSFSGFFTDPGWLDTHTIVWDFDDGTGVEDILYPVHVYFEAKKYIVTLTVTDDDGGEGSDTITVTMKRIPIPIDIKPGSLPNSINPKSRGVIPVAILNDITIDPVGRIIEPDLVDPNTVIFGPECASPVHWALEDVDGDDDIDLILHFRTQDTGIAKGDELATLYAELYDGTQIIGEDNIRTVPPY